MNASTSKGAIEVRGPMQPGFDSVLSNGALNFVADLHRRFNDRPFGFLDE